MSRVKGGIMAAKRRRNILEQVKGYRFGRGTKKRQARDAIYHAQLHSFARINAALQAHGMKYNVFINTLLKKEIKLDRKVLATLANERPEAFDRVIAHIK
jgi:large subunit ribosomal protein L20